VAVTSAGRYIDHLQLAPDRQPRQHHTTQFSQVPDAKPTMSKHWMQGVYSYRDFYPQNYQNWT